VRNLKDKIYKAAQEHFKGHIKKHVANAEIIMYNPVGIGEHPDIMESLEKEIEQIAHYDDLLASLEKYLQ
tara:strand:+ start:340 stop:549 length:210 start_codon:yes stop_codon:yes gene_type:complete